MTPVTGWIEAILISGACARNKVGTPAMAVVAPTAAEYLRNVLRFILFFIKHPPFYMVKIFFSP
jgi:hypothetical protein